MLLEAETKVRIGTLFSFSPSIRPKQAQTRARSDFERKDELPPSALPKVFDSPVPIPGVEGRGSKGRRTASPYVPFFGSFLGQARNELKKDTINCFSPKAKSYLHLTLFT